MQTKIKKGHQNIHRGSAIVSEHVKDYGNDPYFLKKAEKAAEMLEKWGLPDFKKK